MTKARRSRTLTAGAAWGALLAAVAAAAPAHAQSAPVARFFIRAFQVKGNHLITPDEVEDAVYPFMGPDRTADDVEQARAALQSVFQKKGYATVAVSIPEQGVDGGIIELDVQPQTVGQLEVVGVDPKAAERIKRAAPSLQPGTTPNFDAVQADIVALNQTADRRVTPEVRAGTAPGTVDVTLKAEEHVPLHGSLEFNNDQSPSTSAYRVLGTVSYADLWGRGDSLSVSGQTAPQRADDATVGSVNYLTHIGRVQLLGYYVYSNSDVAVVGGTEVVGKGNMAGLRAIIPISQSPTFYQSITAGIDWKAFGEDVRLGADRSSSPITYYPATISWRGDVTNPAFKSDVSLSATFGLRGLGDGQVAFDNKRYQATPDFFAVKLDGSHTQELPYGAQGFVHLSGQWTGAPLISNEQFSIGGLSTVRGYAESELLGDYGAAIQTELRTLDFAKWDALSGWTRGGLNELRLRAFADAGWEGIYQPLAGQRQTDWLGSAGLGATAKFVNHLNGSVDLGLPLTAGPNTRSNSVFTRFRIWGEF